MPTVLVATLDFPPDVGGLQEYAYQFCACASRCDVVVLAPTAAGSEEFDAGAPFPVVRAPWPKGRDSAAAVRKLLALPRFRRAAAGLIERRAPEAVLCFTPTAALAAAPAALRSGTRAVIMAHGIDAVSGRWAGRKIALMRQADTVVALSRFTRELLTEAGVPEERIAVLHPGVNLERFRADTDPRPAAERFGLEGKRVLLTVGRLDPAERYKGHDAVIRALPQTVAAVQNVLYVIAGKGDDRARLEQLVADEGVAEHVLFAGFVEDELLPSLYAASDCYVMLSGGPEAGGFEGFGIVYLEAAAVGRPAIAGDFGGAAEAVVHGKTGLLVPPGDVAAAAEAIVRLLSDDGLRHRLGEGARARAETEFGWPRQAARLEDVVLGAVGGKAPSAV
ncbi:MAG: glycosyltransferase family 4 protein [Armatimonadota bacterium]|jgi:phosphatidylinositol alpha-1,6-mannosyltransferase